MSFVQKFLALDAALIKAGFPPLSRPWRRIYRKWLSGRRRTLNVRGGRRSGKSINACKVAVAFGVLLRWKVPPGETATIAIVSVSISEAQSKLKLIKAMLAALGVPLARETTTEVELANAPVTFRCLAASARTSVGFSAALVIADEVARWRDEASGANPAREVMASVKPALATFPNARMIMVSAPLGRSDYHATEFDRGDTADQMVAHCATWEGNPTITEQQTHELEPDPRIWAREYAAIPQAGLLSAFEPDDVERAFKPRADITRHFQRFCFIDASSGKHDTFAWAFGGWDEVERGQRTFSIDRVGGFTPKEVRDYGIDAIASEIGIDAKAAQISLVFGDQREGLGVGAAFGRAGLRFVELPWTSSSKPRAVARLRRLLLEGRLQLAQHLALRREMLLFEEKIDPGSGMITFAGHTGDHLACLITACLADEEKLLRGSPITQRDGASRDRGAVGARVTSPFRQGNADGLDRISVDGSRTRVVVGRAPTFFSGRTGGF